MDILGISAEKWVLNEEEHLKQLITPEVLDKVPLINSNDLDRFKDGILVRFRGMVQDMYGPEYYTESFDVINNSTNQKTTRNVKYSDGIVVGEYEEIGCEAAANTPSERHRFVAMSIPGINAWVEQYESEKYRIPIQTEGSRPTTSQKRNHDEAMDVESQNNTEAGTTTPSKKTTSKEPAEQDVNKISIVSREHILNHPLDKENPTVCHVILYKDFEGLKLNDTCEFVGFLRVNPVIDALFHDRDDDCQIEMEIETHHPPGSLVPRIHVVHYQNMQHNNPLIGDNPINENMEHLGDIKKNLLIVLTQLLLGDTLAAEYLICHLISEVYSRRNFMPLGTLSLNISNIPDLENIDYAAELYKLLEMLVTKSHYLPLTIDNMNLLTFIPKKDYECDRLTSGILQLSKNTLLLLDETKLNEGQLGSIGINAVHSLGRAIKDQKVLYDFKYFPIEYECNIRFLILSEGKSILPSDIHIPLKPDDTCLNTFSEILMAARHFLKPDILGDIRSYLTSAQFIKYEISDNGQDLIQQEFVNMRQRGGITVEDLHRLLVLTRLICLSEGKSAMEVSCWRRACEMEQQRKARLIK